MTDRYRGKEGEEFIGRHAGRDIERGSGSRVIVSETVRRVTLRWIEASGDRDREGDRGIRVGGLLGVLLVLNSKLNS